MLKVRLVLIAVICFGLTGLGSQDKVAKKKRVAAGGTAVVNADVFIETALAGSNTSQLTAANITSDIHGGTCTSAINPTPLTDLTLSTSGWLNDFTSMGFNVKVGGTTYSGGNPPSNIPSTSGAQAGIGWAVNEATIGTNGTQKAICSFGSTQTKVTIGFLFKTGMTGTGANLYNFGIIDTDINGYEMSAQWADKASGLTGCTSAQLGFNIEVFDAGATHHGTCMPLSNNTTYWVELQADKVGATATVKVFNVPSCSLVGTSSTTLSIGADKFQQVRLGTEPDGGNATGTTFLSNLIVGINANAIIPGFGC